jgi:hypothetical protein
LALSREAAATAKPFSPTEFLNSRLQEKNSKNREKMQKKTRDARALTIPAFTIIGDYAKYTVS